MCHVAIASHRATGQRFRIWLGKTTAWPDFHLTRVSVSHPRTCTHARTSHAAVHRYDPYIPSNTPPQSLPSRRKADWRGGVVPRRYLLFLASKGPKQIVAFSVLHLPPTGEIKHQPTQLNASINISNLSTPDQKNPPVRPRCQPASESARLGFPRGCLTVG